ncbi:TPA: phage tail protein [Escherichia coli]
MSALLTKAFEKWIAECTASNLPARPDAIIFALMGREPTREDNTVPEENITYAVNELTCGQLSPDNIVCSAVVPDDCAFSYDWICLIHQASGTLCGVIKTPVRQKVTGESLIRNFTIIYSGIAQAAQITVPPQSWQVDIFPEINKKAPLDSPAFTGTPTTPTPPDDAAGLETANAAFVRKLLAALVDSSPEALDTLNELAVALGNDPNFAATVMNALAGKQPLSETLTSLSGLDTSGNEFPYFSDRNVMAMASLSAAGRELIGQGSPEDMVNYLGITGTNYCRFRGELSQNGNINTLGPDDTAVGVWAKNINSGATIANGFPENDCQGILEVFIGGAYSCTQRFTTAKGNIYTRSLNGKWNGNGPWSAWKAVGFQPVKTDYSGDLNNLTEPGIYSSTSRTTNVPLLTADGAACPGVVEVICRNSAKSVIQRYTSMTATAGLSNRVYHRTQSGATWSTWREEIYDDSVTDAVINTATSVAGNDWGSPGVGGLILASYYGESDTDNERTIKRGQVVPGSRLGMVAIRTKGSASEVCASEPQFFTAAPGFYPHPGVFMALSGGHLTILDTSGCFVGLFMRVS